MKRKKLAIIGCGNIARFHVEAFKAIGMKITDCASSKNSKTIKKFANKHEIDNYWNDPYELAKSSKNLDGVILCAETSQNSKILDILIKQKIPTLVEKPVSTKLSYLRKFKYKYPKFVMVGFHRRYYWPVEKAIEFIKSSKSSITCTLKIPEKIYNVKDSKKSLQNLYENSVHGFDLINFLFKEKKIIFSKINKHSTFLFSKVTYYQAKKNTIIIKLNPNSPDNFYIEMENHKERFLLKPFEQYFHYKDMKVINPSIIYPIRKYEPNIYDQGSVFSKVNKMNKHLKPGFLNQASSFIKLIEGNKDIFKISANLKDAYFAQLSVKNFIKK